MLIKYAYKAGATRANMSADMAKLLANVPIANLSSDCDKVLTQVLSNTIPSNWEYFDQAGDRAIIRSMTADGLRYKYASIYPTVDNNATTTVAYSTAVTAYEDWNVATHTGTNQAVHYGNAVCEPCGRYSTGYASSNGSTPTNAGTITLYATNRCAIIDGVFIGEYTRDSLSIDDTYPCVCVFPLEESSSVWGQIGSASVPKTNSTIGACRHLGLNGDIYAGSPNSYSVQLYDVVNALPFLKTAMYRTPEESEFLYGSILYFKAYVGTLAGGRYATLGKIYDLVTTSSGNLSLNLYDEVQMDGVTYMLVGLAPGNIWVRKG